MPYIGAAYLVQIDDPITNITSMTNAALKVGRDTHNLVDFSTDDTIILRVGNANEVELTPTALYPTTRDGVSLGTTDKEWSDLFLADSSVIVMGEGNDVTVTHDGTTGVTIAANPITIDSGGDIELNADGGDVTFKDASVTLVSVANASGNGEFRIYEGANYVGFKTPALSANQVWVLPNADGSANQYMKTDGSGNLTWASASAGVGLGLVIALS